MNKGILFFLLFTLFPGWASSADLKGVRLGKGNDTARIVFDLTEAVDHRVFTLSNPSRLVVDFADTKMAGKLPSTHSSTIIDNLRSAPRNRTKLRVVADLASGAVVRSFMVKPGLQSRYHRLVVELQKPAKVTNKSNLAKSSVTTGVINRKLSRTKPVKTVQSRGTRDVIVAIDAGHGGKDSGARGRKGTLEKNVVLDIARNLANLIDREPGMKAVLIRNRDVYLKLRQRMAVARKAKADLFISIHADAFRDPNVHGSSVWTLSKRGASNEASRWLAKQENAADLVGGVSLDDKDHVLASVLLDLSQAATTEMSAAIAKDVLKSLKKVGRTHKSTVQHAGFVVLKSPDIPSILVETAFISNPHEERRLRSASHQKKLAKAMLQGIRRYYRDRAPAGTWFAAQSVGRTHKIARGDTLSDIADQYRVSLNTLRVANNLRNDRIRTGQILKIPQGS